MSTFKFKLPTLIGGTSGKDILSGTIDNDVIYGYGGDDHLYGGRGNDSLVGGEGNDHLYGEWGDDFLDGGAGNDKLYGGSGNDILVPGTGNNLVDGGDDFDTVDYSALSGGLTVAVHQTVAGSAIVTGQDGLKTDTLLAIEKIIGSKGSDTFVLGRNLEVDGGKGDDLFLGDGGGNIIRGGDGIDTVSYDTRPKYSVGQGVDVDLSQNRGDRGDRLTGIENVTGTTNKDTLRGDDQANVLRGGAGADTLMGGGGADRLYGGTQKDELWGGSGADRFVFTSFMDSPYGYSPTTGGEVDTIMDFRRGEGDKIEFEGMGPFVLGRHLPRGTPAALEPNLTPREIAYTINGDMTTIYVNTDWGFGAPEMEIQVWGIGVPQASDFVFS